MEGTCDEGGGDVERHFGETIVDYTDILPIIQQFVNVKAVAMAIVLTQMLKYVLPSPDETLSAEVIKGHWTTRLLPLVPILIGIVYCTLVEPAQTTMENVIRGIFTGAMGAWGYRTTKVSVFGQ